MRALVADIDALWQGRRLLSVLTIRELRSRFSGSALGLVWLYGQPLLTLATFYLVFDVVLQTRLGSDVSGQSLGRYLVAGMVPWMAFCDGVSRGMNSLLEAGPMLKKNALPPVFFPTRSVAASVVAYLPLIVLVAFVFALMNGIGLALLALLPLVIGLYALMFLMACGLSIMAAAMRDVVQVVGFCLSLGVYLSPILFPISLFPEALRWLLWLNPATPLVLGFQSVLLAGELPAVQVWLALAVWLALVAAATARLIHNSRDQLVDWL